MSGSRRNRSPEEQARRAKIRELLQGSNISSMADISRIFCWMRNGDKATLSGGLVPSAGTVNYPAVDNGAAIAAESYEVSYSFYQATRFTAVTDLGPDLILIPNKTNDIFSACFAPCRVVVLDGRQPACVLRLA